MGCSVELSFALIISTRSFSFVFMVPVVFVVFLVGDPNTSKSIYRSCDPSKNFIHTPNG